MTENTVEVCVRGIGHQATPTAAATPRVMIVIGPSYATFTLEQLDEFEAALKAARRNALEAAEVVNGNPALAGMPAAGRA